MPMMMDRDHSGGGHCNCKLCLKPGDRRTLRGPYRADEDRQWREDVRDLPQGESWMHDMFNAYYAHDGGGKWDDKLLDTLPYWMAIKYLDEGFDGPDQLPPGFNGAWSTFSAHALLMRNADRMRRAHTTLGTLVRAAEGSRYAAALVNHPRFERVIR